MSNVVVYFTNEGAHFHIGGTLCLFLSWYLKIGFFSLGRYVHFCATLRACLKTNQSTGGIKRSKHGYYNSFNNETIIKLLYEFRNSYKVLIHHGIPLFLIYF